VPTSGVVTPLDIKYCSKRNLASLSHLACTAQLMIISSVVSKQNAKRVPDRQTDRPTDIIAISMSHMHDKN